MIHLGKNNFGGTLSKTTTDYIENVTEGEKEIDLRNMCKKVKFALFHSSKILSIGPRSNLDCTRRNNAEIQKSSI